jgi:uncharacterized protein
MSSIGRQQERKILAEIWQSSEAEFVAIYGRRRVGKTYLVRDVFENKELYLEVTGIKNGNLNQQLENFMEKFSELFYSGIKLENPTTWRNAFKLLTEEIQKLKKTQKTARKLIYYLIEKIMH